MPHKIGKTRGKKHYKIHHHPEDHDYYYTDYESWYKKITEDNECPECNEPVKKTGIKRECSFLNKHLTIYGDPRTLAYQRKEVIILPPLKPGICDECGHTLIDDVDRGEWYCSKCGLVSDNKFMLINGHKLPGRDYDSLYFQINKE